MKLQRPMAITIFKVLKSLEKISLTLFDNGDGKSQSFLNMVILQTSHKEVTLLASSAKNKL